MDDGRGSEYFNKATAAALAAGDRQYSDDEVATARARAMTMLGDMDSKGMKSMRNLSLAIGMPAAKAILELLVEHGTASESCKADLMSRVKTTTEPPAINDAVGCIEVKIPDEGGKAGACTSVYLVLGRCPKNHDLGAQLGHVFSLIPEEKQPVIKQHLSMLVIMGRTVFSNIVEANAALLTEIQAHLSHETAERISAGLQIDPANTTLYVEESWDERVGLFVKFE